MSVISRHDQGSVEVSMRKRPKQEIVGAAGLDKLYLAEGYFTVGVSACDQAAGIRRHATSKDIVRAYNIGVVLDCCHVEAIVAQRVERPMATVLATHKCFRDTEGQWLQPQEITSTKHTIDSLSLLSIGDRCLDIV